MDPGWIIFDNVLAMSLSNGKGLVRNVRLAKSPGEIATNAGTRTVRHKAEVASYGTVWIDEHVIAYTFGLSDLSQKHRLTLDFSKEDAFLVHKPSGVVKGSRAKQALHAFKVPTSPKLMSGVCHLIDTVRETCMGCTKRQVQHAVRARELYHSLSASSLENFRHILKLTLLQNVQWSERMWQWPKLSLVQIWAP